MSWILKFSQSPKSLTSYLTINKVLNIIEYGIIRHRTFYDIVIMGFTTSASDNKIRSKNPC